MPLGFSREDSRRRRGGTSGASDEGAGETRDSAGAADGGEEATLQSGEPIDKDKGTRTHEGTFRRRCRRGEDGDLPSSERDDPSRLSSACRLKSVCKGGVKSARRWRGKWQGLNPRPSGESLPGFSAETAKRGKERESLWALNKVSCRCVDLEGDVDACIRRQEKLSNLTAQLRLRGAAAQAEAEFLRKEKKDIAARLLGENGRRPKDAGFIQAGRLSLGAVSETGAEAVCLATTIAKGWGPPSAVARVFRTATQIRCVEKNQRLCPRWRREPRRGGRSPQTLRAVRLSKTKTK